MMNLTVKQGFFEKYRPVALRGFTCHLVINPSPPALLAEIESHINTIRNTLSIEDLAKHPHIAATRKAYRACGKEPARYRPSAEALLRRILKGKSLYFLNNAIDIVNLTAFLSGISIGAFDLDQIDGPVQLQIGKHGTPYEAIGRGQLNIGGMPVLADDTGPFGSPTSDSVRTRIRNTTTTLLFVMYHFTHTDISGWIDKAKVLFEAYADAKAFTYF